MSAKEKAPAVTEALTNTSFNTENYSTKRLSLRQQFISDFSISAFQVIDDEQRIVGKYGEITQFNDGSFDVWFIGPGLQPLSTRRLNSIRKNIQQEGTFTMLEGEGYARGRGRDFVLLSASLAGVKKKRRVSERTKKKLAESLAEMRHAGRAEK